MLDLAGLLFGECVEISETVHSRQPTPQTLCSISRGSQELILDLAGRPLGAFWGSLKPWIPDGLRYKPDFRFRASQELSPVQPSSVQRSPARLSPAQLGSAQLHLSPAQRSSARVSSAQLSSAQLI